MDLKYTKMLKKGFKIQLKTVVPYKPLSKFSKIIPLEHYRAVTEIDMDIRYQE